MKQMKVVEKAIGENTFFLKPFPAFTAANISGELSALLAPMIGGIAAVAGNNAEGDESVDNKEVGFLERNIEDVLPAFSSAFSALSGDKVERLLKKLLIENRNVSVETPDGDLETLTYDLANEIFCGEIQDMYILCIEVIKINFGGFFKKLGTQFGNLGDLLQTGNPSKANTENSI